MRSIRTNNRFYIKSYSKTSMRLWNRRPIIKLREPEIKHTTIGEKANGSDVTRVVAPINKNRVRVFVGTLYSYTG